MSAAETKVCALCRRTLPITQFWRCGGRKRHSYCKPCANDYTAVRRERRLAERRNAREQLDVFLLAKNR